MRVDLFCSGSKGNSCLVRTATTSILIDCGPSTKRYMMQSLQSAKLTPDTLDALLITHSHSDHIRQLAMFTQIPIYTCCPLSAKDYKGNPVQLDLHTVARPSRFVIGDLTILAVATSHDSGPSMGFVIDDGFEKLVYITDTGYLPAELYPSLSGADYYIFESNHDLEMLQQTNRPFWLKQRIASDTGHMCNADSSRLLARLITPKTRQVVLAHLSEEANTPQLALQAFSERLKLLSWDTSHLVVQAAAQWEPLHFGSMHPEENRKTQAEIQHTPASQKANTIQNGEKSQLIDSSQKKQGISNRQTASEIQSRSAQAAWLTEQPGQSSRPQFSGFAFDSSPDEIPEDDFDFELPEIPGGLFESGSSRPLH